MLVRVRIGVEEPYLPDQGALDSSSLSVNLDVFTFNE